MATVFFKEKQHFRDIPVLVLLGLMMLATLYGTVKALVEAGGNYGNFIILFVATLSLGVWIWWLTRLRLKVSVSDKKIKYKMSPIHPKKQSIKWEQIENCELVKTPPVAQWSGGNISFNHEQRISVTGRNGLAIKTKEGKHYFIGCHNIEQLKEALDKVAESHSLRFS
jgi:hypothetical protein